MKYRRCALYLKPADAADEGFKLKKLHDYADANSLIITVTLYGEADFLACREDFDLVITTETILLPVADIEIIKVL
jgi:hypothetical protein